MRVNSFQLIKSCGTGTDPTAGTIFRLMYRDSYRRDFTTNAYCTNPLPLCLSVNDLQDSFFPDNDRLSITLQTIFIFDLLDKFVIDEKTSIPYLDKKIL